MTACFDCRPRMAIIDLSHVIVAVSTLSSAVVAAAAAADDDGE
jgi:hypothetical protein